MSQSPVKYAIFRSKLNGELYGITLDEEFIMSVQIYTDIRDALQKYRPELVQSFRSCTNKVEILNFLEKNFPFPDHDRSWSTELLIRTPAIIKEMEENKNDK